MNWCAIFLNGSSVRSGIARFGALPIPHQDGVAAFSEMLACQLLDRIGGIKLRNVDIDRRHVAG